MVKPIIRTKSVGTKVTEGEYAQLEALAGGRSMGEWVRDVLLRVVERSKATAAEETLLAELLALRTILLNVVFKLAKGEPISADEMNGWIERADGDKRKKAVERFQATK